MFQKDCGSYLLVLFIRCLDVINWFGNKKSIWLVSLPIRFLPFGKVQLSNKELQGFQYCWPSHCWITLDNSGFDWSEEVSKEEANKKRHEYVSLVPACWTEIHGYFWFWKKHAYIKNRLLMDPVPSGFTFKWFFKPTFFVQSYETSDFTVFSIVLVCPGHYRVGPVDSQRREVGKSLADADLKAQRVMSNLDFGIALEPQQAWKISSPFHFLYCFGDVKFP